MEIDQATSTVGSVHQIITDEDLTQVLQRAQQLHKDILALLRMPKYPEDDEGNKEINGINAPPKKKTYLPEYQMAKQKLMARLAVLRYNNFNVAMRVREDKVATAKAREEVDGLHLKLQNLYYERDHLLGEIDACNNYQHPYKQLPMISEAEFLAKFPDWQTKKLETDGTENSGEQGLMRARIEHEKQEREKLRAERTVQEKVKENRVAAELKSKDDLGKLDGMIETWIKSADNIVQFLDLNQSHAEAPEASAEDAMDTTADGPAEGAPEIQVNGQSKPPFNQAD